MKLFSIIIALIYLSFSIIATAKEPSHNDEVAWLGIATHWAFGEKGERNGVTVAFVWSRSPASKSGLQEGDTLTTISGKPVTSPAKLASFIKSLKPEDAIEITFERNGQGHKTTVTLGRISPEELEDAVILDFTLNQPQIDPEKLSKQEAEAVWAIVEDETKMILLESGFSPEHAARVIRAMSAGEKELRKKSTQEKLNPGD